MSNLIDLQLQIQKLQKQADDIKSREFDKTVQDIRAKMLAFGITLKDLQVVKRNAKPKKNAMLNKKNNSQGVKNKPQPVAAKFRGPNGETWSGRGLTPRWLTTLLEQGSNKADFAINQ